MGVEQPSETTLGEVGPGENKEDRGLMFVFWELFRTLENNTGLQRGRID